MARNPGTGGGPRYARLTRDGLLAAVEGATILEQTRDLPARVTPRGYVGAVAIVGVGDGRLCALGRSGPTGTEFTYLGPASSDPTWPAAWRPTETWTPLPMRRTRADREAEFVAYVEARQRQLRRIAYAICGNWDQAEDLLQTALAKLYVAWPRVHLDGREDAYVRQFLVRANIDEHQRPWTRHESPGLPDQERAGRAEFPVEERSALFDALQALPTMQRKVVVLRHWLGLSVQETAAELTSPRGP